MKREKIRSAEVKRTNFQFTGRVEDVRSVRGREAVPKKSASKRVDVRGKPL